MGKITGFMEYPRESWPERPIPERIHDYKEIYREFPAEKLRLQGARCMDCGIPFCNQGCPLGNYIPEWNDLVYRDRWREAIERLHATNNFPEFTGLLCPAPCEGACVLGINEKPVTIKYIEFHIIDHAFKEGWIVPQPPRKLTGKRVAVVGSGPAGLACAQQLARVGHKVTVFERDDRIGGLLRYGIPDFKMQKERIDRRIKQMEAEGVVFKPSSNIGVAISVNAVRKDFDAVALCAGATQARDLAVPGRDLKGVHLAMEYLTQQNRVNAGDKIADQITAKGKKVIILGGGDTGADCLGTAHRQGAAHIWQLELLPRPPDQRAPTNPWPQWPVVLRTSSAHNEGGERDYSVMTKKLSGENGVLKKLHAVRLEWLPSADGNPPKPGEIPGSEFELEVDLLLLAMGFTGPEKKGPITELTLKPDPRGNVEVNADYMTSVPGVFAAGDAKRGASLIVWAIAEGRKCARGIDQFLMGETELP
ncbi:MAG: glutamate synthase subunit beta [Deltaproteobacteria bacterium]|nr:glutamate synthase subunit beta [Deltaproteobacteria bacterium]